jgi:hypothetical protein
MNDLDRGFRNFHITDYGLFSPIHVDILCILVTLMFPWKAILVSVVFLYLSAASAVALGSRARIGSNRSP